MLTLVLTNHQKKRLCLVIYGTLMKKTSAVVMRQGWFGLHWKIGCKLFLSLCGGQKNESWLCSAATSLIQVSCASAPGKPKTMSILLGSPIYQRHTETKNLSE